MFPNPPSWHVYAFDWSPTDPEPPTDVDNEAFRRVLCAGWHVTGAGQAVPIFIGKAPKMWFVVDPGSGACCSCHGEQVTGGLPAIKAAMIAASRARMAA